MSDAVDDILGEIDPPPRSRAMPERLARTTLLQPEPRDCLVALGPADNARPHSVRQAIELVAAARDGGVMLVGWVDDTACTLDSIVVAAPGWRITFDAASLVRVRRPDVEQALGISAPHLFGFCGLVAATALRDMPEAVELQINLKNGGFSPASAPCRAMSAEALRDLVLGYLHGATYLGNPQAEGVAALDGGMGAQALALNRAITQRITAARHVERFGTPRRRPLGSIIVCLYGKPEFLFVQNALFAGRPGIEDYEFIYVCNSPDMTDALLAEARAAHMIYGLNMTIVLLPGNAGFGAANNAGAAAALGRRILNVNPDVFPRQADWAARHTALLDSRPESETRLFGLPLYYDDGSLMHGGMYFELDPAVLVGPGRIEPRRLARVEHYGKGAPAWSATHVRPRPVPAVTGAFMSSDRAWYERLGGFTEDYIFGHYEDADLCLKSLVQGTPVWLHDIRLWHLEGKGSIRRPHHEGGSLVNRWLFTRQWTSTIGSGLTGPAPGHKLMQLAAALPAIEVARQAGVPPARRRAARAERP